MPAAGYTGWEGKLPHLADWLAQIKADWIRLRMYISPSFHSPPPNAFYNFAPNHECKTISRIRRSFRIRNTGSLNTEQLQADSWAGRGVTVGKHMVWVRLWQVSIPTYNFTSGKPAQEGEPKNSLWLPVLEDSEESNEMTFRSGHRG